MKKITNIMEMAASATPEWYDLCKQIPEDERYLCYDICKEIYNKDGHKVLRGSISCVLNAYKPVPKGAFCYYIRNAWKKGWWKEYVDHRAHQLRETQVKELQRLSRLYPEIFKALYQEAHDTVTDRSPRRADRIISYMCSKVTYKLFELEGKASQISEY